MSTTAASPDARRLLAELVAGAFPDQRGRFGPFGGRYVPETLIPALERLERGVRAHLHEREFQAQLARQLKSWVGRPTALTSADRLSGLWGARVWLKREDLAHTGAHKINNAMGQALLAQRLGAKRIVAETGAGQHGVASAAACARLGLPCTVYMGSIDMERQAPNVGRMRLLGAEVVPVLGGDRTLRAAIDEALRAWVSDPLDTYYLLGSVVGPHPYPYLVRELQSVIGREARIAFGSPGVLHGTYSLLLQNEDGQVQETHSVSAGLDYPGVGPEHALLSAVGRVHYETASDEEALEGVRLLSRYEGILPALESAHAIAAAARWARRHPGGSLLVCLSGRGDKDMSTLQQTLLGAGQP